MWQARNIRDGPQDNIYFTATGMSTPDERSQAAAKIQRFWRQKKGKAKTKSDAKNATKAGLTSLLSSKDEQLTPLHVNYYSDTSEEKLGEIFQTNTGLGLTKEMSTSRRKAAAPFFSLYPSVDMHPKGIYILCTDPRVVSFDSRFARLEQRLAKFFKRVDQVHILRPDKTGKHADIVLETSNNLVVGDIVQLQKGDTVMADVRILRGVVKVSTRGIDGRNGVKTLSKDAKKSERPAHTLAEAWQVSNLALMGMEVKDGTAQGVVIGTGLQTVWGRKSNGAHAEKLLGIFKPRDREEGKEDKKELLSMVTYQLLLVQRSGERSSVAQELLHRVGFVAKAVDLRLEEAQDLLAVPVAWGCKGGQAQLVDRGRNRARQAAEGCLAAQVLAKAPA
eukprot:g67600.t1